MAQGTLTIFDEAKLALLDGTHNLANTGGDVFKVAFINSTTVPTAADLTPALVDYTESSPATGNYAAGGFTMTDSLTEVGGTVTYDFTSDIAMAKSALNPTDVFYGLIYNSTNIGKEAIGFVEINAAGANGTTGAINVTWGANIFTLA